MISTFINSIPPSHPHPLSHLFPLRHDNWGLGAAWKLDRVEVTNTSDPSEEFVIFPCKRWLDKQHGLEAILTPDRDGDGQGDALEGGVEVEYHVAVHTSDIRFAGTDANVFIEMHGTKGSMGERKLEDRRNLFERGAIDNFKFLASDVGDVEKVIVRHDNSGLGPDWHLKQISIYSNATGKTYFFPCDKVRGVPSISLSFDSLTWLTIITSAVAEEGGI